MILIRIFRICAITEAITWLGLLFSMYEKYIADTHSSLIHIMGSLHGYAFLAYVLVVFLVRAEYGWSNRMTLLALRRRDLGRGIGRALRAAHACSFTYRRLMASRASSAAPPPSVV